MCLLCSSPSWSTPPRPRLDRLLSAQLSVHDPAAHPSRAQPRVRESQGVRRGAPIEFRCTLTPHSQGNADSASLDSRHWCLLFGCRGRRRFYLHARRSLHCIPHPYYDRGSILSRTGLRRHTGSFICSALGSLAAHILSAYVSRPTLVWRGQLPQQAHLHTRAKWAI